MRTFHSSLKLLQAEFGAKNTLYHFEVNDSHTSPVLLPPQNIFSHRHFSLASIVPEILSFSMRSYLAANSDVDLHLEFNVKTSEGRAQNMAAERSLQREDVNLQILQWKTGTVCFVVPTLKPKGQLDPPLRYVWRGKNTSLSDRSEVTTRNSLRRRFRTLEVSWNTLKSFADIYHAVGSFSNTLRSRNTYM